MIGVDWLVGVEASEGVDGCSIIPMPSLLAEPSRPRDIILAFASGIFVE